MFKNKQNNFLDKILFPLLVTVVGGVIVLLVQINFSQEKDSRIINSSDSSNNTIVAKPNPEKITDKMLMATVDYNNVDSLAKGQGLYYYETIYDFMKALHKILSTIKIEHTGNSLYSDTIGYVATIKGNKIEMWQSDQTIGVGTVNYKDFREFFISDENDHLLLWFRNTTDTFGSPYPITRSEFFYNKRTQNGCIISRLYLANGKGTLLDSTTAKSNLDNSLHFWKKILDIY